jgi:NAD-dependent SIR2 family protein deacetylase
VRKEGWICGRVVEVGAGISSNSEVTTSMYAQKTWNFGAKVSVLFTCTLYTGVLTLFEQTLEDILETRYVIVVFDERRHFEIVRRIAGLK